MITNEIINKIDKDFRWYVEGTIGSHKEWQLLHMLDWRIFYYLSDLSKVENQC